ncbi:hypothetical protein QMG61_05155 [Cryobacterium sp. PH31-AA6]|uniref:hypothetical protein n=1 Tax=Cryobacterium sp. PH31-AA6 TaxID=3046205 RepID=UPI0024BA1E40|nr:hypothetical protein [Cryobacterium sp. PH31-AA6]MDJ0323150.1 hypothetical protein [Cryobacterium sp. PH31-AA6]
MSALSHLRVVATAAFPANTSVAMEHSIRRETEPIPVFGDDSVLVWNLNCLGRPANANGAWGRISFIGLENTWLTYAKEIAMILLNPSHPLLLNRGVFLSTPPRQPRTVRSFVKCMAILQDLAKDNGFPASLTWWSRDDFINSIRHLQQVPQPSPQVIASVGKIAALLYTCRSVLSEGGIAQHPWPNPENNPLRGTQRRKPLATQPVSPELFYPLIQAAWAYVSLFSVDIIAARGRSAVSNERPRQPASTGSLDTSFDQYMDRDDEPILLKKSRHPTQKEQENVNWRQLSARITGGATLDLFTNGNLSGRRRRHVVAQALQSGRISVVGGVFAPVQALPGRDRPWRDSFDSHSAGVETRMLREACYVIIASMTMMRDSEVQELQRGSVTAHYGVAALKSPLIKNEPHRPLKYWWITDPVQKAIEVLESTSPHETHLFSSSRASTARSKVADQRGFHVTKALQRFRKRINETVLSTGLSPIPAGPITPHMLRRTMALLTEYEHGGQIAAGLQLKHSQATGTSNALTASYSRETERWAKERGEVKARTTARLALDELAVGTPKEISAQGPGGSSVQRVIGSTRRSAAQVVDKTTRARLLAAEFPDMRFGTINLCLGDKGIAACLTKSERETNTDVKPSMCVPSECPNSVLLPTHIAVWKAEEKSLLELRSSRRLSALNRARIDSELLSIRKAIRDKNSTEDATR